MSRAFEMWLDNRTNSCENNQHGSTTVLPFSQHLTLCLATYKCSTPHIYTEVCIAKTIVMKLKKETLTNEIGQCTKK
jgi:hypothetical protein